MDPASVEIMKKMQGNIDLLHQLLTDSIADQFAFRIVSCDASRGEYRFTCRTAEWMQNAAGTLHGGISSAILDQAMGYVVYCLLPGDGIAPSIQLQTSFHRPLIPGKDVAVSVRVISATRTLFTLYAEAGQEGCPERVCVSGTGTYFYKSSAGKMAP